MANTTAKGTEQRRSAGLTAGRLGVIAVIVLMTAGILSRLVYLGGNLRSSMGALSYSLADLLYGPVWGASLVVAFLAFKEVQGPIAPRRMNVAMLTSMLTASTFLLVAVTRASNRAYHIRYAHLHLDESSTVLTVWTTLVAGLEGGGFHLLGWTLLLIGSIGWSSRRLPPILSALYLGAGFFSLFVYASSELEGFVLLLGFVIGIWQAILFWNSGSPAAQAVHQRAA